MANRGCLRLVEPPAQAEALTNKEADRYKPFGEQAVLRKTVRIIADKLEIFERCYQAVKKDETYAREKREWEACAEKESPLALEELAEKFAALHSTAKLYLEELEEPKPTRGDEYFPRNKTALSIGNFLPATFAGSVKRTYTDSWEKYYSEAKEGAAGLLILGTLQGGLHRVTEKYRGEVRKRVLDIIENTQIGGSGKHTNGKGILRYRRDEEILRIFRMSDEELEARNKGATSEIIKLVRIARRNVLKATSLELLRSHASRIANFTHTFLRSVPAQSGPQSSPDEMS